MNKVEEMLKELCPNGVEYKALGEVCEITKGQQLNKDILLKEGKYPVINGGINPSGYWQEYNCLENTITISQGGASAGYVNYIIRKFWAGAHCYVIKNCKDIINYKFLYYIIKNYEEILMTSQVGAGIPSVPQQQLAKIKIPIPPMAVQREIVKILDNFAELTAELTAELNARKKQYEFYRNKLLTFDTSDDTKKGGGYNQPIEWKTLGTICNISAGGDIPKTAFSKIKTEHYTIPIISNGIEENAIYGYTNVPKILEPSITISARGTIGYCALRATPYYPIVRVITLIPKENIVLKYLKYILEIQKYKIPTTGIPQLTIPMIKEIVIPIPPLDIQQKIVAILDKFDTLVNDLTAGLPAEIEARKKQYTYFRDKLLTFKKAQ